MIKPLLCPLLCFLAAYSTVINTTYAGEPWAFSIGTYSLEGDFGRDSDTTIHMLPVSLAYTHNQWQYKLSTGYASLDGDRNVISEGTQENQVNVKETGLADSTLSAKYRFSKLKKHPLYLSITAKVKFPTADYEKRLGTGKRDSELRLGAHWRFQGWWGVMDLGYKSRQKPRNTELNNTSQIMMGALKAIDKQNTLGMSGKFRKPSQPSKDPVRELIGFYSHKVNFKNNITLLVTKGFSDASPSWGLGTQWRYSF